MNLKLAIRWREKKLPRPWGIVWGDTQPQASLGVLMPGPTPAPSPNPMTISTFHLFLPRKPSPLASQQFPGR